MSASRAVELGSLPARPPMKAAGSISRATTMNATRPARQPPFDITSWPSGAQKNVPMEPAADTMPNARLRRCGATTRAAMLEAMPEVVHESAMPISTPAPSVTMAGLVAMAVITSPAM